ncbi:MAG TPA: hypothetical protein VFJ16_10765 [Longimicrobium sp.]|nr:hypothetical protein [Longimicrobium sp.]
MRTTRSTLRLGAGAALLALAALAGCGDRSQPLQSVMGASPRASATPVTGPMQILGVRTNVRQRFRQIAEREVPGFAGLAYDSLGTPVVYLTDVSRRAQAAAAVRPFLEQPRHFAGGRRGKAEITVRQVRYDYVQLTDWYRAMVQSLVRTPGLVVTSIDHARNQLQVGVSGPGQVDEAVRRAVAAGVPRNAFYVEVSLLRPLSSPSALNGTWDSIPAGTRVRIVNPSNSQATNCTAGFNVADPDHTSDRWFMTAAHCTSVFGAFSSTSPDQVYHNWSTGRYLGAERWDTAWSVNAQRYWYNPLLYGPECPSGAVCRAADVAWVKYDTASWHYGSIAHPQNANAYPGGSYLAINGTTPVYRITTGTWYAMEGETVSKVGGTSGLTNGTVTSLCSDLYWTTGSTPQVILCTQVATGNGADTGDSGAPVFQDLGNSEASFVGILIAGHPPTLTESGGSLGQFAYSPFEGIMSDIPPWFGWPQIVR